MKQLQKDVKAMVFPVVMSHDGCESRIVKTAERQRNDAFDLWCWRRLLRVPWTATVQPVNHKGNQSWIFIGRTDAEAETPILWPPTGKELTHWNRPWCWERLKAGGEGDDRGGDGWMASLTAWTWVWVSSRSWWWTGKPGVLQSMGLQRVGQNWATELTETWIWTYLGGNLQNKKFSWNYMGLFSLKMLLRYFCHFKSKLHNRKKCNHTKVRTTKWWSVRKYLQLYITKN